MSRNSNYQQAPYLCAPEGGSGTARAVETSTDTPRCISLAEARRKALEDSQRAEQERIAYSEREAQRWYDYKVDE